MQVTIDGKKKQSRYWAFCVYEDSAPENWRQILRDTYIPCAISPLHDRDIDEITGELKKPHYHVLLVWGNTTTSSNADSISKGLLNQTICINISAPWGYYMYFDHHRETDKQLYDHKDIILMNGLTEAQLKVATKEDERRWKMQIHSYIHDHHICEIDDLYSQLSVMEDLDLYDYATSHFILFNGIICSFRNKNKAKEIKM